MISLLQQWRVAGICNLCNHLHDMRSQCLHNGSCLCHPTSWLSCQPATQQHSVVPDMKPQWLCNVTHSIRISWSDDAVLANWSWLDGFLFTSLQGRMKACRGLSNTAPAHTCRLAMLVLYCRCRDAVAVPQGSNSTQLCLWITAKLSSVSASSALQSVTTLKHAIEQVWELLQQLQTPVLSPTVGMFPWQHIL